jgi:hypothetical protein
MKKYFETLGLKEGASQEEIQASYDKLSDELDPAKNNNQEFFKEEYEKVQEAYDALSNSSILATENGAIIQEDKTSKPVNKDPSENEFPKSKKRIANRDFAFGGLLFFIATGIWGIFFQNMGFISSNDHTQKVRVVNTVEVDGSVRVDGGYIDGTIDAIDVNLEAINGKYNVFYDNDGDENFHRIPVYDFK